MTDSNIPTTGFPVFTAAALALLVCKLSAFPTISWWIIIVVWLFPAIIAFSIIGVLLIVGLVLASIASVMCAIISLFNK